MTIIPNKGAYVVGISQKDIRDIYEIRSRLEGLCARWACDNITKDQLDELEADGRICCVRPQEPITIGRFEGDENKLLDQYNRGHREGREALDKVRGYLEK